MNTKDILNKAGSLMHKAGFKLKQSSPEILVVTGIAGVIGSVVMACKATTKISTIQEKAQEQLDAAEEALTTHADEYSEEDYKKDKIIIRTHQAIDYAKLYAPAAICGIASLGCIIGSHTILRKRIFNLGAAYTAIDNAFKKYRDNVKEKYGEEIDKELRYGVKKLVTEEKVKDENGKTKKVKTETSYIEGDYSGYARIFDETNKKYERNSMINNAFLMSQQNYWNDRLHSRGYVFLNEVYESLGFDKIPEGQIIGWVDDPDRPNCDGYISFGIFESQRPKAEDFRNGFERAAVLDFNVDGPIVDYAFTTRKKAHR